jgi:mannose-P-dolichol utilization defect 1
MEQLQSLVLNPLKPIALPITTNLPSPVQDAAISLLGKTCHKTLILNLDITSHPECLSLAISKALGIAIITAASVVKVPQIIKLARSQSAEGLSFSSYILETASFLINLAYNVRSGNPFSTYGEVSLILVQDVLISVMILWYSGKASQAGAFLAAVGSAAYALMGNPDLVSQAQMTQLQAGGGVLSIASKLPQILTVYSQGGTGQLSAFAVFNYLAGSLSRIFTTLQEVDDKLILYGFVAGYVLNAVLAAQMVYYWNSPATKSSGQKKATQEKVKMASASGSSPTSTGRATPSSGRRKA